MEEIRVGRDLLFIRPTRRVLGRQWACSLSWLETERGKEMRFVAQRSLRGTVWMFEASLPVVLTTTSEVGVGVSTLQLILRTR